MELFLSVHSISGRSGHRLRTTPWVRTGSGAGLVGSWARGLVGWWEGSWFLFRFGGRFWQAIEVFVCSASPGLVERPFSPYP